MVLGKGIYIIGNNFPVLIHHANLLVDIIGSLIDGHVVVHGKQTIAPGYDDPFMSCRGHQDISKSAVFGQKIILNEFVAFSNLSATLAGMSDRTVAIVTFSLCGFANLSSIAILLGGLGSLVPEKKELIARFGVRAVAAGSLSNLMSACLAGLLL